METYRNAGAEYQVQRDQTVELKWNQATISN